MAKSGALMRCVGRGMCTVVVQLRGPGGSGRGSLVPATGSRQTGKLDPGWPIARPRMAPHPGGPGCPSLPGMWGDPSAGEEGHAVMITQALGGVGRRSLVLAPWTWLRHLTGTRSLSEPAQRNQKCSPQPTACCSFNKAPLLLCPRHKANHRGTI